MVHQVTGCVKSLIPEKCHGFITFKEPQSDVWFSHVDAPCDQVRYSTAGLLLRFKLDYAMESMVCVADTSLSCSVFLLFFLRTLHTIKQDSISSSPVGKKREKRKEKVCLPADPHTHNYFKKTNPHIQLISNSANSHIKHLSRRRAVKKRASQSPVPATPARLATTLYMNPISTLIALSFRRPRSPPCSASRFDRPRRSWDVPSSSFALVNRVSHSRVDAIA